ncbi:MAG: hypothetical protein RLZZ518_208 [Actinomycetota bacterium]
MLRSKRQGVVSSTQFYEEPSGSPYDGVKMSTVETAADLEQLVADLLEEAHALRMKYEEFSRYTEAKVAEFVSARRELQTERDGALQERDYAFHHLALVQQDLHILRQRQDQLHEQLHKAVKQRDRARARVAALEASRAVRIAVRIRKLLRR